VFWNTTALYDGGVVSIRGDSRDLVRKWLPFPQPGGDCSYEDRTTAGEFVSLTLGAYNATSSFGWVRNVSVSGDWSEDATLLYQPCGALVCPAGVFCDGDEDAAVWLCREGECLGYGLFEKGIEMGFQRPTDASFGVYADYFGNTGKFAAVTWLCDPAGISGQPRIAENVTVANRTLRFDVWAVDACVKVAPTATQSALPQTAAISASPEPTPTASSAPASPLATASAVPPQTAPASPSAVPPATAAPTPAASQTPTPTPLPTPNWAPTPPPPVPTRAPLPSPDPVLLACNSTHYALLDLAELAQAPYGGPNLLFGGTGEFLVPWVAWHPWERQPCPQPGACDSAPANLFVCFPLADGAQFCHASADARFGTALEPLHDFDGGALLRYGGAYGHGLALSVACAPAAAPALPFDSATALRWGPDAVSAAVAAPGACPRPFVPAFRPAAVATPIPTAAPAHFVRLFARPDGRRVDMDLFALPAVAGWVAVPLEGYAEQAYFALHFTERKEAPWGPVLDRTVERWNGWRCGEDFCGSVAHSETGLAWRDSENGVEAVYGAGYGALHLTVRFVCNESMGRKEAMLAAQGWIGANGEVGVKVATGMACPTEGGVLRKLTGGAVFLLIVLGLFVGYVGIGTLLGVPHRVTFPNQKFWGEVAECIHAAILWITCRPIPHSVIDKAVLRDGDALYV
jgi:hypothetical protein